MFEEKFIYFHSGPLFTYSEKPKCSRKIVLSNVYQRLCSRIFPLLSKKARKKPVITVNKGNGGEFSIIRLVKGMHKHLSLKSQFSQLLDL
jgi:hypothetical protein